MSDPAPQPLRPLEPDPDGEGRDALARREQEGRPHFALPLAAMAEALRANAEALRRIDGNQRRIAASIEKGDKATRLVASTRNLNETFRNLGEIQRGLLDAVVRDHGRGRGLGWAFAALALLAGLLGFVVHDRLVAADRGIPVEVWEQARARTDDLARELATLREEAARRGDREGEWRTRLDEERARAATLASAAEQAGERVEELEADLANKEASLREYLAMKEVADRTGAVMTRNTHLERELGALKARLTRAEDERERLLGLLAEAELDARGGDPDAIRRSAEELGVVAPAAAGTGAPGPRAAPDGPVALSSRDRRRLTGQVNRLLRQAPGPDSYELLDCSALEDGAVLHDARLGRYRDAVLVGSLMAARLELVADPSTDTLELRLHDGTLVNTSRPGERIPLAEGGHSIFLRELGLADWLRRGGGAVVVGEDGRLTWPTPPS